MSGKRFFRMRDKVELVEVSYTETAMGGNKPASTVLREFFCEIGKGAGRGGRSSSVFFVDAQQNFEEQTLKVTIRAKEAPELADRGKLSNYVLRETTGQKRRLRPVSVDGGAEYDQFLTATCKVMTHAEIEQAAT